jgi:hypothetical protein
MPAPLESGIGLAVVGAKEWKKEKENEGDKDAPTTAYGVQMAQPVGHLVLPPAWACSWNL